jgi:hypothetical protein
MAAVWAAVGFGFSAGSPPVDGLSPDDEDVVEEFEFELLLGLSLLLRLQPATINTSTTICGTCFIISPFALRLENKRPCTATANGCQLLILEQYERRVSVAASL